MPSFSRLFATVRRLFFSPTCPWQRDIYQLKRIIDYVEGVVSLLDQEGASVEDVKAELREFVR